MLIAIAAIMYFEEYCRKIILDFNASIVCSTGKHKLYPLYTLLFYNLKNAEKAKEWLENIYLINKPHEKIENFSDLSGLQDIFNMI